MAIINKHSLIGGIVGAVVTAGALFGINEGREHNGIAIADMSDNKYAIATYTEKWGKRNYNHVDIFCKSEKGRDVKVSEFSSVGGSSGIYLEDWHFEQVNFGVARFDGLPKDIVSALDRH